MEDVEDTERVSYIDIPIANKFSRLENVREEIVDNHETNPDSSSQTYPLQCETCERTFLSETNLNEHKHFIHRVTAESSTQITSSPLISKYQQTSDELKKCFDPYDCFYCESRILCGSSLSDHVKKCHVNSSFLKQQPLQSKSYEDQLAALQTMFTGMQTPKVKCEICYEEFLSDGMVELHKRSEHDPTSSIFKKNRT